MKLTYALLRKQRTHNLRCIVRTLLMKLAPDRVLSVPFTETHDLNNSFQKVKKYRKQIILSLGREIKVISDKTMLFLFYGFIYDASLLFGNSLSKILLNSCTHPFVFVLRKFPYLLN